MFARLRYEDNSGAHTYDIARDSVTVGRGGMAYRVDVRVEASADVSREHLRLRRDPATGRFYVVDLSSLGTTVDGRRVPKGYEELDGSKRENGVETVLPDRARLGLADTVSTSISRQCAGDPFSARRPVRPACWRSWLRLRWSSGAPRASAD